MNLLRLIAGLEQSVEPRESGDERCRRTASLFKAGGASLQQLMKVPETPQ